MYQISVDLKKILKKINKKNYKKPKSFRSLNFVKNIKDNNKNITIRKKPY